MASIIETLDMITSKGFWKEWRNPALRQFILTGQENLLRKLPKFPKESFVAPQLISALPVPDHIDDSGRRFLQACQVAENPSAIGEWMRQCAAQDNPQGDHFTKACALVLGFGCPKLFLSIQVASCVWPLLKPDGTPSPAGHFLLSVNDQEAKESYRGVGDNLSRAREITTLFVTQAPQRWRTILEMFNQESDAKRFQSCTWVLALDSNPALFLEPSARAFERLEDWYGRFEVVAAWSWRTASGYEGLTVLFWDPSAQRWNSWTESRPRHQLADFKPAARYTQPGPWEGAESPRQLSRSGFRLMHARRNPGSRLSGSSKSRVLVTGSANLIQSGLVAIEDWSQLLQQSNASTSFGLMEANPLDSVFALKPAAWGQHGYDPVRQVFGWVLADAQQHSLLLEITFDEFTEPAIRFLETVPPASLQGALVIGRVQRTPRGFSLHPYSLHQQNGQVVHLGLDNVNAIATPATPIADATDEGFEEEEEAESATISSPAMSCVLDEVEDGLLALAESGLAALNPLRVERVRQIALRTERLGLPGLATGLGNMVAGPNSSAVLRCSYLSQLHRRAFALST